jgi:hypothetical protein
VGIFWHFFLKEFDMDTNDRKIVECEIVGMPQNLFDGLPEVMVKYAGSDEFEQLFTYYPDELSFAAGEFVGKTRAEALELKRQRDVAYLRS